MRRYLIRLDDACPTMDREKWGRMEEILDCYGIKPMVGVIPHNEDPKQMIDSVEDTFFDESGTLYRWISKGWVIALHGYNHCYTSNGGMQGMNPLWERSEFAGLPLNQQKEKIRKGIAIMRMKGIEPQYFFAPSHTFDENTLKALKEESNIRVISDTIATKPYKYRDFVFLPQLGGHCAEMKIPGTWTFCLHPSTMNEIQLIQTENFLKQHKEEFICFEDIDLSRVGKKTLFSSLLSWAYFMNRRIKGQK